MKSTIFEEVVQDEPETSWWRLGDVSCTSKAGANSGLPQPRRRKPHRKSVRGHLLRNL